jgi:hypothetical protein
MKAAGDEREADAGKHGPPAVAEARLVELDHRTLTVA